jgi:DNA-binding CsgD family transcriptional regulator
MYTYQISQLTADRQAGLIAATRQQHLAQQARAARRSHPGPRRPAAPMLAALGRLTRRRPSPRAVHPPAGGTGRAAPVLTPRELDVLKLVGHGLTNPDIARQLVLSEHTVYRHLANILRKLSLSSRAAAGLGRAHRIGLSMARWSHLSRLCESGPNGRSDSAAPPDTTCTTGNGFAGDCHRAGEAVDRVA